MRGLQPDRRPRHVAHPVPGVLAALLLLLAGPGRAHGQDGAARERGIFVPVAPAPGKRLRAPELRGHAVVLVFDVEDSPDNREQLAALLARIPPRRAGKPPPLGITLYGETGETLTAGADPPSTADAFFSYADPEAGKTFLCTQPFTLNTGTMPDYVDVGRVLALSFTIPAGHGRLPLRQILVTRTERRPPVPVLMRELGCHDADDPEVVAWSNRWLSTQPSLEDWAAHLQLDPADPRTKRMWEGAVSFRQFRSRFTLKEAADAFYADDALAVNLYEDSFGLGRGDADDAIATRRVTETLWSRLDRTDPGPEGGWEEVGTYYACRDLREQGTPPGEDGLAEIAIDARFVPEDGAGASPLAATPEATRTQRLQATRRVRPASLILMAMPYRGRVEEIRAGPFVLRRYAEIRPVSAEPTWTAMGLDADHVLRAFAGVAEEGASRPSAPVDPEVRAVLRTLEVDDLGETFPLAGRWQQIGVQRGDVGFVLVGPDGSVHDGSFDRPGSPKIGMLSDLRPQEGSVTVADAEGKRSSRRRIRLESGQGTVRKVVFHDAQGAPLCIWYRR